ncbi:hypothetical protein ACOSP7_017964 [Xanthoceras sorbifolium]|uniref:Transmembrane protein n=1 Tax=Xanthoceras sorbifolium TaxID=99658 RepID=A0ABQ8I0A0_9ROSI|nr:hypothetical protein JRO89_XS05G0036200 [Xanthoceras sorbifolium]
MSSTPPLNLCTVISETKRILNAHSRHFLALSVLFLLPLSFSIIVYPTLQQLLLNSTQNHAPLSLQSYSYLDSTSTFDKQSLLLPLAYTLFAFVFSLCAVGSITYSVFHGFYGRPVKLLSAIRSIFTSFLPLLVTTIASQIIVSGLVLVFAAFLFLVVKLINSVNGVAQFDYSSPYSMGFAFVVLFALLLVLVHLNVNWALASVVVVVESSWGFKPLKRSANLIKGYKLVVLSFYLYYSFFVGIFIWSHTALSMYLGDSMWKNWGFVLQIVFPSTLLTLLFLQYMAANTVLYMYCKAMHGELATEIAEEFAKEYVSLPFDDGKVPHLVSVAYAT